MENCSYDADKNWETRAELALCIMSESSLLGSHGNQIIILVHTAPTDGSTTLVKVQLGLCVNIMLDCHIIHVGQYTL
jgi:hypothetical protein